MDDRELMVGVEAGGALRARVMSALEADGISVVPNGGSSSAHIRVVSVDLSGPVSLRHLRAKLKGGVGRTVALSPQCGALGLRRALKGGADSLVLEHEIEDGLAPALRAVAAGLSVMPSALRASADRLAFSYREREVLRMAIEGRTNSEIAATLFLAESTIKSHLSSAYHKLGASGRKDAASLILDPDEGLVDLILGREASHRDGKPGLAALG